MNKPIFLIIALLLFISTIVCMPESQRIDRDLQSLFIDTMKFINALPLSRFCTQEKHDQLQESLKKFRQKVALCRLRYLTNQDAKTDAICGQKKEDHLDMFITEQTTKINRLIITTNR